MRYHSKRLLKLARRPCFIIFLFTLLALWTPRVSAEFQMNSAANENAPLAEEPPQIVLPETAKGRPQNMPEGTFIGNAPKLIPESNVPSQDGALSAVTISAAAAAAPVSRVSSVAKPLPPPAPAAPSQVVETIKKKEGRVNPRDPDDPVDSSKLEELLKKSETAWTQLGTAAESAHEADMMVQLLEQKLMSLNSASIQAGISKHFPALAAQSRYLWSRFLLTDSKIRTNASDIESLVDAAIGAQKNYDETAAATAEENLEKLEILAGTLGQLSGRAARKAALSRRLQNSISKQIQRWVEHWGLSLDKKWPRLLEAYPKEQQSFLKLQNLLSRVTDLNESLRIL